MKNQSLFAYPTLHNDDCRHLTAAVTYASGNKSLKTKSTGKALSLMRENGNSPWIPEDDPLTVTYQPDFNSLKKLFESAKLIIPQGAKPAIALYWQSKDSLRSGISSSIQAPIKKGENSIRLDFDQSSLRGELFLEVRLFLGEPAKSPRATEKHLCNIKGAILGTPGDGWKILADGTGSTFPLFFVSSGKTETLWALECDWENCMVDKFDAESVRLNINLDHPDCPEEIKHANATRENTNDNTETPSNPGIAGAFTRSIVRSAIGTLILQIQQTEPEDWQSIKETKSLDKAGFQRGSVAHAAWHFYSGNSLNDQSPAALMQTAEKIKIKI